MKYYILTFDTATAALQAERALSHLGATIIPVPSDISEGCGFALRLPEGSFPLEQKVPFKNVFAREDAVYTECRKHLPKQSRLS